MASPTKRPGRRASKPAVAAAHRSSRSLIATGLIVVAFAGIGFIGYKLYANPLRGDGNGRGQAGLLNLNASADADGSVPTITTSEDLDKAGEVLDAIDTSAEGAAEVDELNKQLDGI